MSTLDKLEIPDHVVQELQEAVGDVLDAFGKITLPPKAMEAYHRLADAEQSFDLYADKPTGSES